MEVDKADIGESNTQVDDESLKIKVVDQIQYYFSDVNLTRDKFLLEQMTHDDSWIEISTLLTFNRLRQLTTDGKLVVSSLKKFGSGLLEISEDETKVRRTSKLPDNTQEYRDDLQARTVYVKGFPLDYTLDQVMSYFTENNRIYEQIYMRKYIVKNSPKMFKGSIYITFKTKEDARNFVSEKDVKCGDRELIRMMKKDYFAKKEEERRDKSKKSKPKIEMAENKDPDEEVRNQMTPGAVLRLQDVSGNSNVSTVKTLFNDYSPVAWVEVDKAKNEVCVRFQEGVAKDVLDEFIKKNDGKCIVDEKEVKPSVLEGDDELSFWKNVFVQKNRRQLKKNEFKNRKKGRITKNNVKSAKHKKFEESDDENAEEQDDLQQTSKSETSIEIDKKDASDESKNKSDKSQVDQSHDVQVTGAGDHNGDNTKMDDEIEDRKRKVDGTGDSNNESEIKKQKI